MTTRNTILRWAAATAAVGLAGGLAYRAWRQGLLRADDPSLAPWRAFAAGGHRGAYRLVSAAVLAASPHNTQPWRFSVNAEEILVHADFQRALGAMDPFERELFIGIGCALENIAVAAPGAGIKAEIALLPQGQRDIAARIALSPRPPAPHHLESAIARRRTDRGPYDRTRAIDAEALQLLRQEVAGEPFALQLFARGSAEADCFCALTMAATEAIIDDAAMSYASARWFRHEQPAIDCHCDGVTVQTLGLAPWLSTLLRLLPPLSERRAQAGWLRSTRDVQLPTADQFGVMVVAEDKLTDEVLSLQLGRAWQRLHLGATLLGLACQPLNQIPARICRERQLARTPAMQAAVARQLPLDGGIPGFCFRLGLPTRQAAHSPRRSVAMVARAVPGLIAGTPPAVAGEIKRGSA